MERAVKMAAYSGSAFRATVEARACELALRTVLYAPCSVMGQTSYRS